MQDHDAELNRGSLVYSRSAAIVAMLATSLLMSLSGLIVRNIEHAGPWQINIYRSLAFIVSILIIYYFQNRGRGRYLVQEIKAPAIWAGLCLGVTGVSITQALTTTTIANTMFIMSAIPFLSMLLAYIFLKERISLTTFATIGVAVAGLVVMVADGLATTSNFGNLMAIVTAFGFAGFTVILRGCKNMDMLPSLIIGGLVVIAVSVIPSIGAFYISSQDLLLCIVWGAGLSGVAHWAIVVAARFLNAAELTLFMLLEFALAPLWVWQFANEKPNAIALFGGLMVITSVAIKIILDLRSSHTSITQEPS